MTKIKDDVLYEEIPSLLYEYTISSLNEEFLKSPRLVLETLGFKNDAISEGCEKKIWSLKVFTEDKLKIELLKKVFARLKLSGVKLAARTLKPAQWLTLWTQWKPLSFTKKIDVVPYWYKDKYKSSKKIIYLDTLMSFGTGMHETTQKIAQLIEDNPKQLTSFLDIGTGTGILAIAAIKLGATKVVAMDISPLSVEATKTNLKVNNLKAKVFLGDIAKLPAKETYQMVAANLITDDLLKNCKQIVNLVKPGGLLMISGISLDNLKRLQSGFKHASLSCRKVSKGKEWAAILYAKKM